MKDPWLIEIEKVLWQARRHIYPDYTRTDYDVWVMCPREHAIARLRSIIELDELETRRPGGLVHQAPKLFEQVNRFFPGRDHVFAIGDCQ